MHLAVVIAAAQEGGYRDQYGAQVCCTILTQQQLVMNDQTQLLWALTELNVYTHLCYMSSYC